jgi:hypothetical protein
MAILSPTRRAQWNRWLLPAMLVVISVARLWRSPGTTPQSDPWKWGLNVLFVVITGIAIRQAFSRPPKRPFGIHDSN